MAQDVNKNPDRIILDIELNEVFDSVKKITQKIKKLNIKILTP
jgi:hypothetical protein